MLDGMTSKEIYNKVSAHLLVQNKKSYLPKDVVEKRGFTVIDTDCAYRGEDGLRCAIGCLIPDNEYSIEMEGSIPAALKFNNPDLQKTFRDNYSLLFQLQSVHDFYEPSEWKKKLKEIENKL